MAYESFAVASIGFVILLNIVITSAPTAVGTLSGLNTTSLQDQTNVSADIDSNQTSESNVVGQADQLIKFYTNPNPQNQLLAGVFIVFSGVFILILIDLIWIG